MQQPGSRHEDDLTRRAEESGRTAAWEKTVESRDSRMRGTPCVILDSLRLKVGKREEREDGLLHHPRLAQIPNPFLGRVGPTATVVTGSIWTRTLSRILGVIVGPPREYRTVKRRKGREDTTFRDNVIRARNPSPDGEMRDIVLLPDSPITRTRRREKAKAAGTAVDTGSFSAGENSGVADEIETMNPD